MNAIQLVRVNHINAVVEDFDACVAHFRKIYDMEFLWDLPRENWHAAVISIGTVLFEIFAPNDFFLNSRHGPHYFGIEYQTDLAEAREAVAARGIRIGRDIKSAIHTDPRDGLGISFEFYSGEFVNREYDLLGGRRMTPVEHWRDNHPLGLTGLKGYTVAATDLAEATAFFTGFFNARQTLDEERAAFGARVRRVEMADCFVELMAPSGDGVLRRALEKLGPGIHSTIFGVLSIERTRAYLAEQGIDLVPGTAKDRWAIPAEANCGLIFEFAE